MKYIKYCLLIGALIFSFFISDRVLIALENLSPIMKEIKNKKNDLEIESVNAIIEENTIIPGKNGVVVNERESYLKMNDFGSFNETFFVYDYIKPDISLYDNLDKIIIKGSKDKSVSLLIYNDDLASFLDDEKIDYDYVVNNREEMNKKNAEYIDKNLHLNLKNKICIVNISNVSICKQKKYFLVMPNLSIDRNTLYKVNNITESSIIEINNNISVLELKVILNKIKSHNWDIIKISELIAE